MNTHTQYIEMQKLFYSQGTSDHDEHNSNPWYWKFLLGEVIRNSVSYTGLNALDFGCGKGRNIRNLGRLADWGSIDGVDISEANILDCRNQFPGEASLSNNMCSHDFYLSSGSDSGQAPSSSYNFITSTIVLQHIPVYTLRRDILLSIRNLLSPSGKLSLQMGFGQMNGLGPSFKFSKYDENCVSATSTNGMHNVYIETPNQLVSDLLGMGFDVESVNITLSWSDICHPYWIWVVAKIA